VKAQRLGDALGREVRALRRVPGGDLNDAYAAELDDGTRVFVKTSPDAAPGAYAFEAASLRWLGEPGALPVPEVLAVADDLLALAWVDGGGTADAEAFGRGLAAVHRAGAAAPGALPPGAPGDRLLLGPLALPNDPADDWPSFYAANRLLPLARTAADRGSLDAAGVRAVEAVAGRIDALAGPPEPPARLHGDLWSGNVHVDPGGRTWLIDPAAYGGHREVDLAMLMLFGSPSARMLAAYDEAWPRAEGHGDRVGLWQLFPLLVHAVLFGSGYGASVRRTAERYAG
jgi:fructosamine-3-kinase